MKNLKKVLALVLALATVFGLGISASAKYTDASSIKYTEAVDVMSGIGVLGGNPDGSFAPTKNLTRAQAAKMVSYLLNGGKDVNDLYAGSNTFTDCYNSWAKGYIAYVNQTGVVSGVGNGKFNPDGTLTGVALAKMMLTSLGYDADAEGYQKNNNWMVNILDDAQSAGLLKGMSDVNLYTAITREQASQMMFNALKATMVKYDNKGTEITLPGGGSIVTNPSSAEEVVNNDSSYLTSDVVNKDFKGTMQLCEKYFPQLKLTSGNDVVDTFGRPSDNWTYKGSNVATASSTPAVVFTSKTSADDVAKALKGYKVADSANDNTYKITNAKDDTRTFTAEIKGANSGSKFPNWPMTSTTIAAEIAKATANGKLVELYADANNVITDAVTVSYNFGEVTKVATNKAGDVTYSVSGAGSYVNYADADKNDTVNVTGDVTEGDYVTYVKIGSVAYLYDTTSIQGTQTRKDQNNDITVNDTVYSLHEKADASKFNNSSETFNYYIDQYGFVVATTSTASASTSFGYVIGVNGSVTTTIDGTTPYVEARVVLGDGTVGVYDVALEKDKSTGNYKIKNEGSVVYDAKQNGTTGSNSTQVTEKAKTALNGKAFGYTLSKDNVITFESKTPIASGKTDNVVTANITEITKDKISYTVGDDVVVANQNTKFVVYNAEKKNATVYTGSNNLPKFAADSDDGVAIATMTSDSRATATLVFVNTSKGTTAIATDAYVYIDTTKYVESGSGDAKVYEYTGTYADGTTATLTSSDKLDETQALFRVNEDKTVGGKIEPDGQFLGEKALTLADGVLTVAGDKSYYVTDETHIVYISDLAEVNGNTGFVVLKDSDSKTVAAIFVTKD